DIMDLTRLAVDAGQFINRTVQLTEESLGQTDKTALDPGLEELLALADATKVWTEQIITQTEVLLQPNPGARLEDRLYEHLEWSAPPRPRAHELLGEEMVQAGLEVGSTTPYGTALMRCGGTQKQLGETERKFVQSVNIHFLTPLRSFTEGEYRAIQNERKMLVNKRLDLDIAKSRLMKAHQADREARVKSFRSTGRDYSTASGRTQQLSREYTRTRMETWKPVFHFFMPVYVSTFFLFHPPQISHMRSLTDFVDAQASYFAECQQHAEELQKHLARSVFDLIFKQITQMNAEEMNTAGRFLPASQKWGRSHSVLLSLCLYKNTKISGTPALADTAAPTPEGPQTERAAGPELIWLQSPLGAPQHLFQCEGALLSLMCPMPPRHNPKTTHMHVLN
uniref:BAR domain-containing protein n=1 Tax=Oryzias latipes TaxID=8090 RepID=A0A3P9LE10_ORYLA